MHCTAGDAPVAVKTFVKHTLSKELQLYYEVRLLLKAKITD